MESRHGLATSSALEGGVRREPVARAASRRPPDKACKEWRLITWSSEAPLRTNSLVMSGDRRTYEARDNTGSNGRIAMNICRASVNRGDTLAPGAERIKRVK